MACRAGERRNLVNAFVQLLGKISRFSDNGLSGMRMRGRSHGDGVDSAAVLHLVCRYRMVRAPWLGTGGLMPAANLLNEERVPVQLPLHLQLLLLQR